MIHQPFCSFFLQSVFFSYLWKEICSMQVKLFMENMWEFFLVFHFVPYKVNIPMHAREIFYVFFLFHTKLIFPCMQGDLNKYKEYICWIQVKNHISDQTSLRICNSVYWSFSSGVGVNFAQSSSHWEARSDT